MIEYNLTNVEVQRLGDDSMHDNIKHVLNAMFHGESLIALAEINRDADFKMKLYGDFRELYQFYLDGRLLSDGEESVLNTAIRILIWKVHCKTFKDICWYRYAFAARFIRGFDDLPQKGLPNYSIYERGAKVDDVDYDRIVFDTYDYLDKLIGFKLSDIFMPFSINTIKAAVTCELLNWRDTLSMAQIVSPKYGCYAMDFPLKTLRQ